MPFPGCMDPVSIQTFTLLPIWHHPSTLPAIFTRKVAKSEHNLCHREKPTTRASTGPLSKSYITAPNVCIQFHSNCIRMWLCIQTATHTHTYANLNRFLPLFHHAPESWAHSRTTEKTLFDIKLYRNSQHDAYNELSKKKQTSQCRIGSYNCSKMPTHIYIIYKVLRDI